MANGGRRSPWYAEGLRFSCQAGCGACGTRHDEYAYLYLGAEDVTALAAHLGITAEEFRVRHTTVDDGDLVLRMDGPDCPFLRGTACSVYAARPVQCRTFPFWKETLRTRAAWESLKRFCPGVGRGELHELPLIREQVARREGS